MDRRNFLKVAAIGGLYVPSAFAINPRLRKVLVGQSQSAPPVHIPFVEETFEASDDGLDLAGWSVVAGGAGITYKYTPALSGSQSIKFDATSAAQGIQIAFTSTGTIYGYFKLYTEAYPSAGTEYIVMFRSSTSEIGSIKMTTSGRLTFYNSGASASPSNSVQVSTLTHVWFTYLKGNPAYGEIGFSSTGTRPTSGTADFKTCAGSSDYEIERFRFQITKLAASNFVVVVDDLKLASVQIGDNGVLS